MSSKIDNIMKDLSFHSMEGSMAVKKLCGLIGQAGVGDDPFRHGQHEHGCYGDLIAFLEDNPGAVEALVGFIKENFDEEEAESDEEEEPAFLGDE